MKAIIVYKSKLRQPLFIMNDPQKCSHSRIVQFDSIDLRISCIDWISEVLGDGDNKTRAMDRRGMENWGDFEGRDAMSRH